MIKQRKVLPFHCPTPLFNEVKKIIEENIMPLSFFCRMVVHNMVNDINNKQINSQKIDEK